MKLFVKEVVSSIKNIGAIAPSSKYLANNIIKHIDFDQNQIILEFGCGNGAITKQILKKMPSSSRLISLEINDPFLKHCQDKFKIYKNFEIYNHSAIDFDLLLQHLKALRDGASFEQPVYSFVEHNRTGETITTHPKKVVIVEGILILTQPEIRAMFDVNVFVHADSDERLIRRLKRDISERGRNIDEVLTRYQTTLKPMHQQFIEPTKEFADIIIPTNRYNTVAVDLIRTIISERL